MHRYFARNHYVRAPAPAGKAPFLGPNLARSEFGGGGGDRTTRTTLSDGHERVLFSMHVQDMVVFVAGQGTGYWLGAGIPGRWATPPQCAGRWTDPPHCTHGLDVPFFSSYVIYLYINILEGVCGTSRP